MENKTALDYHVELAELQGLTESITNTIERFKLTYDWIYSKYEEKFSDTENPLPFGLSGIASHTSTLYMAEQDLKRAYSIIKNRQDYIETKLSLHYL